MQWNKRDLNFLARSECPICRGEGSLESRNEAVQPCDCALRSAFRACYARFRDCANDGRALSRVSFDRTPTGRSNKGTWGLKREEYMADFELTARRSLSAPRHKLFRFHHILGASVSMCARRLRLSPEAAARAVAQIEIDLGRSFATMEPYSLYPLWDYFNGRSRTPVKASPVPMGRALEPWRLLSASSRGRQRLIA